MTAARDRAGLPVQQVAYMEGIGRTDADVARALLERLVAADHEGVDPAAVYNSDRVTMLSGLADAVPGLGWAWRSAIARVLSYGGHRATRLARPRRLRYAKGLSLTASAVAHALDRGLDIGPAAASVLNRVDRLLEEKRLGSDWLWAHEHPYRIRGVEIDASTPNLVTTAFVAAGYWDRWERLGDTVARARFLDIVEAVLRVFPARDTAGGGLCFMYTPRTDYHVHNANLMVAEMLAKWLALTGGEGDREEVLRRVLAYSVVDIRASGAFRYAGPPTPNDVVDNYHTGFVLRSLHAVATHVPAVGAEFNLEEVLRAGLTEYLDRFVQDGLVWRGKGGAVVEAHSLAESILIHKHFAARLSADDERRLVDAIRGSVVELWYKAGQYFANRVTHLPLGLRVSDRTEMVRWSTAWMLLALCHAPVGGSQGRDRRAQA